MTDELMDASRLALSDAIAALARIVLEGQEFDAVLGRLTEITKSAVGGAYEVSVTMQERSPATIASTDSFADVVDEAQYDAGNGPCLEALRTGETIVVADQLSESRWPEYTPRAAEVGVRSSVSVPLPVNGLHVAALNVYGQVPDAFNPDDIQLIEDLAIYAAVVVSNADLYFSATSLAEQMADAMKSRAVIEQAKGIMMAERRCSADDAFELLVKLSQQTHRKLREVAQAVIDQIAIDTTA